MRLIVQVLLLKPNTSLAAQHITGYMQWLTKRARSQPKACEPKQTDQSLLNVEFKSRWHRLPTNLVNLLHMADRSALRSHSVNWTAHAAIHFVGEPKPWREFAGDDGDDKRFQSKKLVATEAGKLWQSYCHRDASLHRARLNTEESAE